jgi:hypothetical protein
VQVKEMQGRRVKRVKLSEGFTVLNHRSRGTDALTEEMRE